MPLKIHKENEGKILPVTLNQVSDSLNTVNIRPIKKTQNSLKQSSKKKTEQKKSV